MTARGRELPPVCILAGGLGTRLGARAANRPKALVEVAGQPFVFHQLRLLASHGAREIVLCVGHLGEMIEEAVGSRRFGLSIAYSHDLPGLEGTLGAIRRALPLLGGRFLYLYGDTYLRLDYGLAYRSWLESGKPALMTVLENAGRWGPSNALVRDGLVTAFDKDNPTPEMTFIDYGLGGLTEDALDVVAADEGELSVLHRRLAAKGRLCAFTVHERFYEIGTPEALEETDRFLSSGAGEQASSGAGEQDGPPPAGSRRARVRLPPALARAAAPVKRLVRQTWRFFPLALVLAVAAVFAGMRLARPSGELPFGGTATMGFDQGPPLLVTVRSLSAGILLPADPAVREVRFFVSLRLADPADSQTSADALASYCSVFGRDGTVYPSDLAISSASTRTGIFTITGDEVREGTVAALVPKGAHPVGVNCQIGTDVADWVPR